MDRILIDGLTTRCIVGINGDERREKQDVVIGISVYTDLRKPGNTDRIEDAVDYKELKKKVLGMVEGSSFFLLEALAESIARLCLENTAVRKVRVKVEKPSALRFARSVGVVITREQGV